MDKRAIIMLLVLLVPALFAQGDKYITWGDLPKIFAAISFVSAFVQGILTVGIIEAFIGALIVALVNYVIVIIALKIMGH